jgi:hypothetical protein
VMEWVESRTQLWRSARVFAHHHGIEQMLIIPCLIYSKELSPGELAQTSQTILKKPACFFDIAFKQSIADSDLDHTLHYIHSSYVK